MKLAEHSHAPKSINLFDFNEHTSFPLTRHSMCSVKGKFMSCNQQQFNFCSNLLCSVIKTKVRVYVGFQKIGINCIYNKVMSIQ